MKKITKRITALFLSVVLCVTLVIPGENAQASTNILPTDVSTPSSGCVMLGLRGSYIADVDAALARINEIRREACEKGYPDPRNKSRMLTIQDYKPMKRSTALEYIARIRAAEASVTNYHNRLNDAYVFDMKCNGVGFSSECLASNYETSMVPGINQFYGEKDDWVNNNTLNETGHYTAMINPDYEYVGLGDFYCRDTKFANSLALVVNSCGGSLDDDFQAEAVDIVQKLEVKSNYIDKYFLDGKSEIPVGGKETYTPMAQVTYKNKKSVNMLYLDEVTYSSSDTNVATVSSEGVVSGVSKGTAIITALSGGSVFATITITVGCAHDFSYVRNGMNYTRTCEKCGESSSFQYFLFWGEDRNDNFGVGYSTRHQVGDPLYCWPAYRTVDETLLDWRTTVTSSNSEVLEVGLPTYYEMRRLTFRKPGLAELTVAPEKDPYLTKKILFRVGEDGDLDIEEAEEQISDTFTYDGTEKKLTVKLIYDGITLVSGTDYTISAYQDNVNAGTAKVVIEGKGLFGGTKTIPYTIMPAGIANLTLTLESDVVEYTGKLCTPKVTIMNGEKELVQDRDYTVAYKNNTELGTAEVLIEGCGNYTGTRNASFSIRHTRHRYGETIPEKANTCTEDGHAAYKQCELCDLYFPATASVTAMGGEVSADSYDIPAGHSFGAVVPERDAGCTTPGHGAYKQCTVCERYFESDAGTDAAGEAEIDSFLVSPLGLSHDFSEVVPAKESTCTEDGNEAYKQCTRCKLYFAGDAEGNSVDGEDTKVLIPALGHDYSKKAVSSETKKSSATYDSPAVYYYSCSRCGKVGSSTFTYGVALTKPEVDPDPNPVTDIKDAPKVDVTYHTHIQTYGDTKGNSMNGVMSGTSGESKRLENIWISVSGNDNLGIQYTTHCQSYGWLPWSANGETNGTSGESKRLEAIKISLTGADRDKYDVYYRVHAQSYGWLGWATNGEPSGTAGYGKRLEGIQIVVRKKGEAAPGINFAGVDASKTKHNESAYIALPGTSPVVGGSLTQAQNPIIPGTETTNVAYKTHVQTYGWQGWRYNGAMSGTSGKAKRLEGINIKLTNQQYSGDIVYTTHVQTFGWQGIESNPATWKKNGEMSGTSGKAKRLEAIRIKLTGEMAEHYDVYYRVHAQSFGWLGWAKNGEASGTAGYAKRLEGIQILLVEKGDAAPSMDYMNILSNRAEPFIGK